MKQLLNAALWSAMFVYLVWAGIQRVREGSDLWAAALAFGAVCSLSNAQRALDDGKLQIAKRLSSKAGAR